MAKVFTYPNSNVTVEDRNGSFAENKTHRNITCRYDSDTNSFTLKTPLPVERSEPAPPLYEVKDLGVSFVKNTKGYKILWDINIKAAKIAGISKVKKALGECVDKFFNEVEAKDL